MGESRQKLGQQVAGGAVEFDHIKSIYTFLGRKTLELAGREILPASDRADAVKHLLEEK